MAAVALVFQNCANPAPYDTGQSSSNNTPTTEPGDTTPRLLRGEDDDDFTPPDLSKPVHSIIQYSSTFSDERAWGMVQTSDGGFITAGRVKDDPQDNVGLDVLFKKFNKDGILVYSRRIGDAYENQSYKALELPDTYVVAGLTRTIVEEGEGRASDVLLVRINKDDGDVIDTFRYGTTDVEALHDLIYTRDANGEVLVGVGYHLNRSNGIKTALAVKFDTSFNIIWSNRFIAGNDPLVLQSLAYVPGSGYYAVGFRDRSQNNDSVILRFSYAGAMLGARLLNNLEFEDDLRDVGFDGDDIIAVGRLNGNGRSGDGAIHRFSPNLNHLSTQIVGRNGSLERFMDLNTHPDGSLVLAGTSNALGNTDNWIVKVQDPTKNVIDFSHLYGTDSGDTNQFHSMVMRRDYGYAIITNNNNLQRNGTLDPALLLLNQFGEIPLGCRFNKPNPPQMTAAPNNKFAWQNYPMTSANVPLDVQVIDFTANEDDLDEGGLCVN